MLVDKQIVMSAMNQEENTRKSNFGKQSQVAFIRGEGGVLRAVYWMARIS